MLISFLLDNWSIFAWKPSDMPGVSRLVAEHSLNLDNTAQHEEEEEEEKG